MKFFLKIQKQQLVLSHKIIRQKLWVMILILFMSGTVFSQVPPPPCRANENTGFGGAVGEGVFSSATGNYNPIVFSMQIRETSEEMNDILVLYIDTGAPGRAVINGEIDDSADDHRIAITNSNLFGYGSLINFPPGFEASYAVAIDVNSGGLYSIPATGPIGTGELNFITSVNSTLTSSDQRFYDFSFYWEDIGLTITDEFQFVGLYVRNTGYSSDEGYGEGIAIGTEGSDTITMTGSLTLPDCGETLSNLTNLTNKIKAFYFNNRLVIEGIKDVAKISVYDINGREIYRDSHQINDYISIPIELNKNVLQFIVIESRNKKKILKVIPN
jgi:hypothetical protein